MNKLITIFLFGLLFALLYMAFLLGATFSKNTPPKKTVIISPRKKESLKDDYYYNVLIEDVKKLRIERNDIIIITMKKEPNHAEVAYLIDIEKILRYNRYHNFIVFIIPGIGLGSVNRDDAEKILKKILEMKKEE
jgi:hypothetical protein